MILVFTFVNQHSFGQVTWKTFDEENGLLSIQIPTNWFPERIPEAEKLAPIDYNFRYAGDANNFAWIRISISDSTYTNARVVADSYVSYYRQFDDFRLLEPVNCEKYKLNNMFTCSVLSSQQLQGEPRRNVLNLVSVSPNGNLYELLFITSSNIYNTFLPVGEYIIDSLKIDSQKVIKVLSNESKELETTTTTTTPQMDMQSEIPMIPPSSSPPSQLQQNQQGLDDSNPLLTSPSTFPSPSVPNQLSGQEITNNTFKDPVVGISFQYPSDWTIVSQRYSEEMLNAEQIPESITPIVRLVDNSMDGGSFLVLVEKLPTPMPSELYYELNKQAVIKEPTMNIIDETGLPVTVGDLKGIKYELRIDNTAYNQTQIALSNGTTGYIIAYNLGSVEPVKQMSDISYMLNTFNIQ